MSMGAEKVIDFSEGIIFEILKGVPAKSLMRFKCVSKNWFLIIEDPFFVNHHRARSHTRPGGIQLLSMTAFKFQPWFLSDPEGNSQIRIENGISAFCSQLRIENGISDFSSFTRNDFSIAEGLICYKKHIWNPSTNETIVLPFPPFLLNRLVNGHYHLGFDAISNKYKVFCCSKPFPQNLEDEVLEFHVLQLGENSWKQITFNPDRLPKDILVKTSRSFGNMIFCLISIPNDHKYGILTFDARQGEEEEIGFIPFPNEFNSLVFCICSTEIKGLLSFYGVDRILWVLNHEIFEWKKMVIAFDGCSSSRGNSWVDVVFDGENYINTYWSPIGTIHTNEILLQCSVSVIGLREGYALKCLYFDPQTNKIRFVPTLERFDDHPWNIMIKYVDSVVRL